VTTETRKKSIELSATLKIQNLRSSIDESILKGYWSLGFEIAKLLKETDNNSNTALFVPVSSGTALVGLTQGLFAKLEAEYKMPKIYICQTQNVHPIVTTEEKANVEASLADAIIDTIALRAPQLHKIIKETNGDAFAINNVELLDSKSLIEGKNVSGLSFTSLLAIAGYFHYPNKEEFTKVICIASGF